MSALAVTWWGHATVCAELGRARVLTDPVLVGRLYHLRRHLPVPVAGSVSADVVLISHLHHDHLHLPSLGAVAGGVQDVPVVVPRGAARVVPGLARHELVEVSPGDRVQVAGLDITALPAFHDGRRDTLHRDRVEALGFRFDDGAHSVWFPGDTGYRDDFAEVGDVDLAAVPIGGWGPSLGDEHLDPEEAARAVAEVGARWSLAVHYGTYWPMVLQRLRPDLHHHFFVTPPERFRAAVAELGVRTAALTPPHGERLVLVP